MKIYLIPVRAEGMSCVVAHLRPSQCVLVKVEACHVFQAGESGEAQPSLFPPQAFRQGRQRIHRMRVPLGDVAAQPVPQVARCRNLFNLAAAHNAAAT